MNTIARFAKGFLLIGVLLVGILGLTLFFLTLSNQNDDEIPSASADDTWSVYLLNQEPVELVRVSADGATQTFDLGISDFGSFGGQVAVAPNGSEAAFCQTSIVNEGASDAMPLVTLVIRDLENNSTRVTVEIGNSDGCRITSQSYSADNSLVAVGLINPSANPNNMFWRLLIIDTVSGQTVHELNSDDPLVAANGQALGLSNYFMPEPRLVSNNDIIFTQIAWRTEGFPVGDGVRWNWVDRSLTQAANWGNHTIDWITETGEMVWAGYDTARPAAEPGGPLPQSNVVYVQNANGDVIPVFFTEDYVIIDTLFINSGREIAVNVLEGFDPENPPQGSQPTQWIAIDRAGTIRTLQADLLNFSQLVNAPDSYAFLNVENPAEGSSNFTSILTLNTDGQSSELWTADLGFWSIVRHSSVATAEDLAPFTEAN